LTTKCHERTARDKSLARLPVLSAFTVRHTMLIFSSTRRRRPPLPPFRGAFLSPPPSPLIPPPPPPHAVTVTFVPYFTLFSFSGILSACFYQLGMRNEELGIIIRSSFLTPHSSLIPLPPQKTPCGFIISTNE
jgi:hypothetical protein